MNSSNFSASDARAQTPNVLELMLGFVADCKTALADAIAALVHLLQRYRAACVARARAQEPLAYELTDDQVWRYLC